MKCDPRIYLAMDNCFASKRWTRPEDWSKLIAGLGVHYVEASADTECDPLYMGEEYIKDWRDKVQEACAKAGIRIANLYSGHGTYATLGLAHWDPRVRKRFRDGWLKGQADTAAALGAGLGFFAHAIDETYLKNRERYKRVLDQLYADLADLAKYAAEKKLISIGVEQMYAPHQVPWTIAGAKKLLKEVYERGGHPFYLTDDVGHMNGQQFFKYPTEAYILEMLERKQNGEEAKRIWLGSEKAQAYFWDALGGRMSEQEAVKRILADCEENPHLFAGGKDGNVYAWLEETGRYSPIVHLQQSDGKSSPHWPFDPDHNAKGVIEGEKVMQAIFASCEKEDEEGMPPGCSDIVMTLEPFIGTAGNIYDALDELRLSVEYWRQFVPEDGMRLSEIISLLEKKREKRI